MHRMLAVRGLLVCPAGTLPTTIANVCGGDVRCGGCESPYTTTPACAIKPATCPDSTPIHFPSS